MFKKPLNVQAERHAAGAKRAEAELSRCGGGTQSLNKHDWNIQGSERVCIMVW